MVGVSRLKSALGRYDFSACFSTFHPLPDYFLAARALAGDPVAVVWLSRGNFLPVRGKRQGGHKQRALDSGAKVTCTHAKAGRNRVVPGIEVVFIGSGSCSFEKLFDFWDLDSRVASQ